MPFYVFPLYFLGSIDVINVDGVVSDCVHLNDCIKILQPWRPKCMVELSSFLGSPHLTVGVELFVLFDCLHNSNVHMLLLDISESS